MQESDQYWVEYALEQLHTGQQVATRFEVLQVSSWPADGLIHATNGQYRMKTESFAAAHLNTDTWRGWFRLSHGPIDSDAAYGDINSEPDLVEYIHSTENTRPDLADLTSDGRLLKFVLSESG